MSADTSFFFPFFQQEMEKKNNENETEKEGNGTTFLVTSFPGLLFYSDRKCYIKKHLSMPEAWWLSYLFDHA